MLEFSNKNSKKETEKILSNFNFFKKMLEKNSEHTTNLKNKIKLLGDRQSEEFDKDQKSILENLNNLKNNAENLKKIKYKEDFVSTNNKCKIHHISLLILALFIYYLIELIS